MTCICPLAQQGQRGDSIRATRRSKSVTDSYVAGPVQLLEVLGSHDGADDLDKAITTIQRFLDAKLTAGR